jgi:parallel beta-helix repeat protein
MNPKITKFKILFILIYAFISYLNAATYTVTNTNDAGANSLREALTSAQGAGADVIEFNIAGAGPHTINISSALPQITDDNTFINGLTQIGSSYNTPMIVINGTSAGVSVTGIYINGADNNKIAGIVCQAFNGHGFRIHDGNNNIIQNCFSGTNAAGTSSVANNLNGIMISGASSGNIIGTDSDGTNDNQEANLLSGNTQSGVEMNGINVINNRISGNIIGLNITGNAALGNTQNGVSIASGAKRNLIGTDGNGTNDYNERNVISSNRSGISINGSSGGARENKVAGNFIGTAIDGITDLGNTLDGIVMTSLTKANLIGTNADGVSDALERNIIAGNNQYGVNFSGVDSNVVAGNYIGLDSTGSVILRNNEWGVQIQNSDYNLIGTNGDLVRDAVERNVISGNGFSGIGIRSLADYNKVFGNYIGLDYTGEVDLGNTQSGVQIREGASFNVVGGTATNLLNHISGNTLHGVHIFTQYPAFIGAGPRTNNNTVDANIIGLDVNLVPVGNGQNGIFTELAVNSTLSNNTIFNNGANGILNRGAESSITNNNIRNNGASGIQVTFHIGANGDVNAEFASANDIISSVAISGNTIINNCGTANPCAGIYGFDDFIDPLVNDKGVTLETNNTIGINNGKPDVQQDWHGAIEVVNTGATIVDMPYLVYSNGTGPTYTLTDTVATLGTYGTTYLHGPSGINMTNIYTWKLLLNTLWTQVVYQ